MVEPDPMQCLWRIAAMDWEPKKAFAALTCSLTQNSLSPFACYSRLAQNLKPPAAPAEPSVDYPLSLL